MDAAVITVDQLDTDLATTAITLGAARTAFALSPNAETAAALAIARAAMDELLELRTLLTP